MAPVGIRAGSQGTIQPARNAGSGGCILRMAGEERGKETAEDISSLRTKFCLSAQLTMAAGLKSTCNVLSENLDEQRSNLSLGQLMALL